MKIGFRYAQNYNDLRIVSEMEKEVFGEETLPLEQLKKWWDVYRNGVSLIIQNAHIIGSMGIWPLREDAFYKILSFKIKEKDHLENEIINRNILKKNHQFWYFASIILHNDYRKKGFSKFFISYILNNWIINAELANNLQLGSIAFTEEGAIILEKLHFERLDFSQIYQSSHFVSYAYQRICTKTEILHELSLRKTASDVPLIPARHLNNYLSAKTPTDRYNNLKNGVTSLLTLLMAALVVLDKDSNFILKKTELNFLKKPTENGMLNFLHNLIGKREIEKNINSKFLDISHILEIIKATLELRNSWSHSKKPMADWNEPLHNKLKELDKKINNFSCLEDSALIVNHGSRYLSLFDINFDFSPIVSSLRDDLLISAKKYLNINSKSVVFIWGNLCFSLYPFLRFVRCSIAIRDQPKKQECRRWINSTCLQFFNKMEENIPIYEPIGISCDQCRGGREERKELNSYISFDEKRVFSKRSMLDYEMNNLDNLINKEIADANNKMIGRKEDLKKILELINDNSINKNTGSIYWVFGKPGIGKSYLAYAVASELFSLKFSNTLTVFFRFKQDEKNRGSFDDFIIFLYYKIFEFLQLKDFPYKLKSTVSIENIISILPENKDEINLNIIIDGIDEILINEPKIADIPFDIDRPYIKWLIFSQENRELRKKYVNSKVRNVFENGLPKLTNSDILNILPKDTRLTKKYIEKVLKYAKGFPLYVYYLAIEIKNGRQDFNIKHLPKGLNDYYVRHFKEYAHPYDSTTSLCMLALSLFVKFKEPITRDRLYHFLKYDYDGIEIDLDDEINKFFERTKIFLEQKVTSEGQVEYSIFHNSFRKFIENTNRVSPKTIPIILKIIETYPNIEFSFSEYVKKNGIAHLLEEEKFSSAILFWKELEKSITELSVDKLQAFAKDICNALGKFLENESSNKIRYKDPARYRKFEEEAKRVDTNILSEIMTSFYEVDPLLIGFKLIRKYHWNEDARIDKWENLLKKLIEKNEMIIRYTAGQALADEFLVKRDERVYNEIMDKVNSKLLDIREIGNYALKFIFMDSSFSFNDLKEPEIRRLLKSFAEGQTIYDRGALGELLIHIASKGQPARDLVDESIKKFWEPIWDYNRVEIDEIYALEAKQIKHKPNNNRVKEYYDLLIETDELLESLEKDLKDRAKYLQLKKIIKNYNVIEIDSIRNCLEDLKDYERKKDFCRLLLCHPSWQIREAAATSVIFNMAVSMEEARKMIECFLGINEKAPDSNWKVRYGAVEAAWSYRTEDDGRLFKIALEKLSNDENCRVRGLLSENLMEWFRRGREFIDNSIEEAAIIQFLRDDDTWPLENMYLLCNHFYYNKKGFFEKRNGEVRFDKYELSPLIINAKRPSENGNWPWYTWSREEFILAIEEEKYNLFNI